MQQPTDNEKNASADHPLKIFIVDNNHDDLDLFELFLFRDYDIETFLDIYSALRRIREQGERVDLLITFTMLPEADAKKVIELLKEDDSTALIPVVAIISSVQKYSITELISSGFTDVIGKPFSRDDVKATVDKVLGE